MEKRKLSPPTHELIINQGDDSSFQLVIKMHKKGSCNKIAP